MEFFTTLFVSPNTLGFCVTMVVDLLADDWTTVRVSPKTLGLDWVAVVVGFEAKAAVKESSRSTTRGFMVER